MEDKQIKGGYGYHEKNEKDSDTVSLCDACNHAGIYRNSIRSSKNSSIRGEEDFVSGKKEKNTDQRLVQMENILQAVINLGNMSICLTAMVLSSKKTQLTKVFGTL